MSENKLTAKVAPIREISEDLKLHLYSIFEACYHGTDLNRFKSDFNEKQWVILLEDIRTGKAVGFSTQMIFNVEIDGKPIRALFSGDTILHPDYWGEQALVRAWCQFAGGVKAMSKDIPLYWFLISKGYRTYLYLAYFFHRFHPAYQEATPLFEERLLQAFGKIKYPEEFNPSTGLIAYKTPHESLRDDLDATPKRLRNPHVSFFMQRNPDYQKGTELVCVAEISPSNMRSFAKRELEAGMEKEMNLALA